MISGQTCTYEEGLTPTHQKTLQQPGSSMVTGAGNFDNAEQEKDQQRHETNNGFSAPQQVVVSTTASIESTNPHSAVSAPAGRDGRTFVQEETSTSPVSGTSHHITSVGEITSKALKHLPTSKPIGIETLKAEFFVIILSFIDSVKETPVARKPALITQSSQETTCGTPEECGMYNNEWCYVFNIYIFLKIPLVKFSTTLLLNSLNLLIWSH